MINYLQSSQAVGAASSIGERRALRRALHEIQTGDGEELEASHVDASVADAGTALVHGRDPGPAGRPGGSAAGARRETPTADTLFPPPIQVHPARIMPSGSNAEPFAESAPGGEAPVVTERQLLTLFGRLMKRRREMEDRPPAGQDLNLVV
ncbi:MAG: hypothetical protein H7831_13925 [Magnetococcus sp. WYHC-3]